ncbi:hypothetical protein ASG49_14250 [Marmoricola sp. Leaf446]|uniref:hypothetical protein n=1 Tax=Marmoricola sp. Leaf446 TaxID=1736379 RepID=UPI0006F9F249|nr:hypothetical protein [Marmoricola sp. Leaf446]KQT90883.1 hypothetical protein ASG49_14250 [Marmoricola sp. Leaf446]
MFRKSRKDKLVDQAQSLAHDLTEAIVPRVEKAREDLKPVLSDVRDAGAARLADARDAVAPKLADARDAVAPRLADVRDAGASRLADARDNAAPYVETARDRTILGVQQVVHDVRDQAHQAAAEADRRRVLATAALKGEDVKKGGKGKKVLLVVALGVVGAVVGKKLAGGDQSDNWQSSYTPSPAPAAPAAPATHPVTTPEDPAEQVDVTDTPDPKV